MCEYYGGQNFKNRRFFGKPVIYIYHVIDTLKCATSTAMIFSSGHIMSLEMLFVTCLYNKHVK